MDIISAGEIKQLKTPLSKLEFLAKFTNAEIETILIRAKDTEKIQIWLEMIRLAEKIDIDDVRTIADVYDLEQAGIIAVGRAAEILEGQ